MYNGAEIHYGVIFGKCDASDWIDYYASFTPEEQKIYDRCVLLRYDPNDNPELQDALSRAEDDIREIEESNCLEYGDEYAIECMGYNDMDTDTLTELVHDRDEHALEFFGLKDATDEEIDAWDAEDLPVSKIPTVRDFDPDFEPESPFDGGWILNVEYINPAEEEDLDDETAYNTLSLLFEDANGDYTDIRDFVSRCENEYCGSGSLAEIAKGLAEELELDDFSID